MRKIVILILATILSLSCSGKNEPSPEFAAAKAILDQLIAETFDDTFSDPAFSKARVAFERVPEDAHDYERAQWYVNEIGKAQAARRRTPSLASPVKQPAEQMPKRRTERKTAEVEASNSESKSSRSAERVRSVSSNTSEIETKKTAQAQEEKELRPEENDSKAMSAQKKAYDKVIKDYDKAQKSRDQKLNSLMKEIDQITDESRRGSR